MSIQSKQLFGMTAALLILAWAGVPTAAQDYLQDYEYRGDGVYYRGVSQPVKADVSPPLRLMTPLQSFAGTSPA